MRAATNLPTESGPAMFGYDFDFHSKWWLLILLGLPVLWMWSFRGLASLGGGRRLLALALRSAVFILLVFALAEAQLLRVSDKVAVIYVLDQSESIPRAQRERMLAFVRAAVEKHREAPRGDLAGVVVFGRQAQIEIPPFDDDIPAINRLETVETIASDATNLADALKLAQAAFPEGAAKRIVVVSDGNENLGDARTLGKLLAEEGVGIDVKPIRLTAQNEVAVDKVTLPTDIRRGQTVDARVVVTNHGQPTADNPEGLARGKLKFTRKSGGHVELLSEEAVAPRPGKNVYSFKHAVEEPAVYTYEAEFVPDAETTGDALSQNNRASAFTHVVGRGRVLLIEDWEHVGEFDYLVQRLRANNLEVVTQKSDELFTSLAELQGFDCVVLANTPRTSGDDEKNVTSFSDQQVEMLVRNTEQMGCGLIMLGGPNAFGAGGWANTELEKAMPVDFQIKNAKVRAVGALAMVMHASEIPQGNHWQKVIARKALETLSPLDYCGVIHWGNNGEEWLWDRPNGIVRVGDQRGRFIALLNRMTPGDMPDFDPSMAKALAAFQRVTASMKHMIIISDGDPTPPKPATVDGFVKAGVKITTVAVGSHGPAGHATLQEIARKTGGNYYVVTNPQTLPRIYQREARRISRPLIFEPEGGVACQPGFPHEALSGVDVASLRRLRGYVLTTLKENPLVEQALYADKPEDRVNSTLFAAWNYGLGRSAVFTSDAGKRWADGWTRTEQYDKFFTQLVRWAMRPIQQQGKFTVTTDIEDGKARVVVTALDKDDEFLNFLNIGASAIDPELKTSEVKIRQVAPGRYVGEFDAGKPGGYFLTLNPGLGGAPLFAGVNVPYSSEFRDRETNDALLTTLANYQPKDGRPGRLLPGDLSENPDDLEPLLAVNPFRADLPKARSRQDIWPWLLVAAAALFFGDVFVRRVALGWEWLGGLWGFAAARVFRARREEVPDERIARLRGRKAEVGEQLDQRRAGARFEPSPPPAAPSETRGAPGGPTLVPGATLEEVLRAAQGEAPAQRQPPPPAPAQPPPPASDDSYTARLLEAKKRAKKQ